MSIDCFALALSFIKIGDHLVVSVDKIDSIQLFMDKCEIRITLNGTLTVLHFDDPKSAQIKYKRILELI
jgi:hypothetical protein